METDVAMDAIRKIITETCNYHNLPITSEGNIIITDNDHALIAKLHNELGYIGIKRLIYTLKLYFKGPDLTKTVTKIVSNCIECQRNKYFRNKTVKLYGYIISSTPFEKYRLIYMDRYQEMFLQRKFQIIHASLYQ